MNFKTRLFAILWLVGVLGVLSFLLVDLSALLAQLPLPAGADIPPITLGIRLLSLIQPTVLLTVAVLIGVAASKVGLSSPVAEAAAGNGQISSALKPQIVPGLIGGFRRRSWNHSQLARMETISAAGVCGAKRGIKQTASPSDSSALWRLHRRIVAALGIDDAAGVGDVAVVSKRARRAPAVYFIGAIVVSSVVFGLGHLPFAFALIPGASVALILYVIVGNSIFGLIVGYLYWKKGLESAMIAHMLAHVVMLTAVFFGV